MNLVILYSLKRPTLRYCNCWLKFLWLRLHFYWPYILKCGGLVSNTYMLHYCAMFLIYQVPPTTEKFSITISHCLDSTNSLQLVEPKKVWINLGLNCRLSLHQQSAVELEFQGSFAQMETMHKEQVKTISHEGLDGSTIYEWTHGILPFLHAVLFLPILTWIPKLNWSVRHVWLNTLMMFPLSFISCGCLTHLFHTVDG